jgi:hypothetical protein
MKIKNRIRLFTVVSSFVISFLMIVISNGYDEIIWDEAIHKTFFYGTILSLCIIILIQGFWWTTKDVWPESSAVRHKKSLDIWHEGLKVAREQKAKDVKPENIDVPREKSTKDVKPETVQLVFGQESITTNILINLCIEAGKEIQLETGYLVKLPLGDNEILKEMMKYVQSNTLIESTILSFTLLNYCMLKKDKNFLKSIVSNILYKSLANKLARIERELCGSESGAASNALN